MFQYFKTSLTVIILLNLLSCGKNNDGSSSLKSESIEEQKSDGYYRAIMRPLNNHLSGFIPSGFVEININENLFEVRAMLDDDAKVIHIQSIQEGSRCPGEKDDNNKDGIIDFEEAQLVSGKTFISLDHDLHSESEQDKFPLGGSYTYLEKAELERLEQETKQRTKQNLNLSGRVVLIHGVANRTQMPPTVSPKEGFTPQASVPIVCGILKRIGD